MAAKEVVSSLQREVELAKEGLKNVDENIKKLTGRDPSEARGPAGNRRIVVKRNFGERVGGPPQKRFNAGNTFNRLGPRGNDRNNRRFGQLESDGEEEEDDGKKPTLQSSIVATPTPSRQQQEAKTDKKTQTRNKRMFGVLLGTLQKFKENSTKEAARERKRKQIEKKLEEAAIQEREQAIRKKKELFVARREQQTKLEELERKVEVAEMLEEWEDHDRKLSKFIRTNTKPHIFYLPAKHNDYTLGLLETTAKHVEDEIKKRRQEISEVLHQPADGEPESVVHVDNQGPDTRQEVEHSDDEGRRRVKGRQREVILTRKSREGIDDEIEDTNERKVGEEEVEASKDLDAGREEKEGSDVEIKIEVKEVEDEKVDEKMDSNEIMEEKEQGGDVEMNETYETDISEAKKVDEMNMEERKVERQETSEGKEQAISGDGELNRGTEGEPSKNEDNPQTAVIETEDTGIPFNIQPEIAVQQNESESKMQVDPEHDKIE
ncbi:pinin-like [Dendronephthya gigantea]|uniref:pinin-like n=1 Tax=Dendronephthya gigantea TaxID=151771 RepID=UPI0010699FA5|nr:pinin-like [Dendronephthya gigantea]